METDHKVFFKTSQDLTEISDNSVNLVVTSPPYPMLEMWDELFFQINPEISRCFDQKDYNSAFLLMHEEMNKTWNECSRVLTEGGILCINIGDATRTLDSNFQLWTNHSFVNKHMVLQLGLKPLPIILWRKSTNKPNKFMGSGMLPPNAYVTLEHEYILIFRKGSKREFKNDRYSRYESAFFWEERNNWFSDIWFDIKGTKQQISSQDENLRERSAAYPLELVTRLINMYSLKGDTVLDPFWGTGTTSIASILLGRNSIGYELYSDFYGVFKDYLSTLKDYSRIINHERLQKHFEFISQREDLPKHKNDNYEMGVITRQESDIKLYDIAGIFDADSNTIKVTYEQHGKVDYNCVITEK